MPILFERVSLSQIPDLPCQLCHHPLSKVFFGHRITDDLSSFHGVHYACLNWFIEHHPHVLPYCPVCHVQYTNAPLVSDYLAQTVPSFILFANRGDLSALMHEPFKPDDIKTAIIATITNGLWPALKRLLEVPFGDYRDKLHTAIFNAVLLNQRQILMCILLTAPNADLLWTNPNANEFYNSALYVAGAVHSSPDLISFISSIPQRLQSSGRGFRGG